MSLHEIECMRLIINTLVVDINEYDNVCNVEIPLLVSRIQRHVTNDVIIPITYGIDVYTRGSMVIINNGTGIAMYIARTTVWWNSLMLWRQGIKNNLEDALILRDMLIDYLKIILRYKLDNIIEL